MLPLVKYKNKLGQVAVKPWFSSGLLKSSLKKNKLCQRFLLSPTPHNSDTYKKYKIKSMWNINELLNEKMAHVKILSQFTDGDVLFTHPYDIENGFNDRMKNDSCQCGGHSCKKSSYRWMSIVQSLRLLVIFPPCVDLHPTSRELLDIIVNRKSTLQQVMMKSRPSF